MGRSFDRFLREGLLNRDAPDLSELITDENRKRILVAYCHSKECAGKLTNKVIKPEAKSDQVFCSDCEAALVWKVNYIDN